MNRILIGAMLLAFSNLASSQNYQWPETGWSQGAIHVGDWTTGNAESNCSYTVGADTSMNGTTYKIVHSEYWSDMYVRWDAGQLLRGYSSGNETTLYNFNLSIGDTVMVGLSWMEIVDSVNTYTLPNGTDVRRITFVPNQFTGEYREWVEGIGDLNYGLILYSDFEGGHERTVCVRDQNGDMVYSNPKMALDCDSLTGYVPNEINEKSSDEVHFQFYPNPMLNELNVSTENGGTLDIFSITGERVKTVNLQKISNIRLKLVSGVYFAVFDNGLTRTSKRLVVL